MSLLPSAVFATSIAPTGGASDYAANSLWATAGAAGPGGGVTQLVAGANITLDPPTGVGVVTITASGGGGGGVTSVSSGGPGITCIPTTGAVVVDNTGVTSLVAGTNITLSGATGAVTVNAIPTPFPQTGVQNFSHLNAPSNFVVTGNAFRIGLDAAVPFTNTASVGGWTLSAPITISNPAWNANTLVLISAGGVFVLYNLDTTITYLSGEISCGITASPAARSVRVSGGGAVVPTQMGGAFGGEGALYGLVIQF